MSDPKRRAKPGASSTQAKGASASSKPTAAQIKNPVNLTILHLPTQKTVVFKGGVRSFQDSFSSNWNKETVFGRQDPIVTFQNTERSISFEFNVDKSANATIDDLTVAGTVAAEHLSMLLYPTYNNSNALSLKNPPLLRINFPGLFDGPNGGLLCACTSLNFERGTSFSPGIERGAQGQLTAQTMVIAMELIPLHEGDMGWTETNGVWTFAADQPDLKFPVSKILWKK